MLSIVRKLNKIRTKREEKINNGTKEVLSSLIFVVSDLQERS